MSSTMQGTDVRNDIEHRLEGLASEVVFAVERRRRGEQAQVIRAFGQQPVDEAAVDAVRREYRVGNALRRILVEVETGGAERQIEVRHDRIELDVARDRPGDVMRDDRRTDAALARR